MERNGIASLPISARVRTASESDDQNGLADGGREPGQGSGDGHADQHADPRPGTRSARPERHEDEQHRQPEHQHDREPDHDRPDLARTGAHHVRPEVGQLLDSGGQRNAGRHGCGSRSHNSSVQDLCTLVDARPRPATASSISLLPGTSGVPTARECSRLGAPTSARYGWAVRSPSSSGLGHRPFKAAARVRIPLGMPGFQPRPAILNTFRMPVAHCGHDRSNVGDRARRRRCACGGGRRLRAHLQRQTGSSHLGWGLVESSGDEEHA